MREVLDSVPWLPAALMGCINGLIIILLDFLKVFGAGCLKMIK